MKKLLFAISFLMFGCSYNPPTFNPDDWRHEVIRFDDKAPTCTVVKKIEIYNEQNEVKEKQINWRCD